MGISTKNVRTQFWDARQLLWKWVDTVQMNRQYEAAEAAKRQQNPQDEAAEAVKRQQNRQYEAAEAAERHQS